MTHIVFCEALFRSGDRDYAQRAADKLVEYLFEIDGLRGTGRLYVP